MTAFDVVIRNLRRAELQLQKQLEGVRTAISSLEFGSAVSPGVGGRGRGRVKGVIRKRRRMSAEARAKIAAAQRARWARVRSEKRK